MKNEVECVCECECVSAAGDLGVSVMVVVVWNATKCNYGKSTRRVGVLVTVST